MSKFYPKNNLLRFYLLTVLIFSGCVLPNTPLSSATPRLARSFTTVVPSLAPERTLTPTPTSTPTPTPTPPPTFGGQTLGDPYAPQLGNTGYDVQHYFLQVNLDPSTVYLEGVATITAQSNANNLVQLALDFVGFEVDSLSVDGEPAPYQRESRKLIIDLHQPLWKGDLFTVTISYHGVPITEPSPYVPFFSHLGLQFLPDNVFVVSEPDGARYWFPSNDHPRDKATFRFEVIVPEGLTGVANGVFVEEVPHDNGTTSFIWEHDFPMATYLAMVSVGDYTRIDSVSPAGVPIRHYIFPELGDPFRQATDMTGEALDWMSELFIPYPFDTFGFTTTRLFNASLETQSMVVLSEKMLNEETVVHEIAHQWFGNWVSLDSWADMWHNEGLAIYITLLWQTRNDPRGLDIFMESVLSNVAERDSGEPLGNLPPQRLFGYESYWKGAALFHSLRLEVGDEAFFEGLRLYLQRFGGGTASREDFQSAMEQTSGMELDAFFAEWLE